MRFHYLEETLSSAIDIITQRVAARHREIGHFPPLKGQILLASLASGSSIFPIDDIMDIEVLARLKGERYGSY
jgi:hypothetical protein